ncbi:TetR/AcrR family transcriptional regulator [Iamia sp. SCSIO 61187]|uniref:TetR/AcrR family transcriptional regulator n=1 Tax=Iamia sp. SCSIO 61187 TaxID=2722752 RepID=UPI001C639375|nr:TetR/AcrR family transcriptional regulator [Iamia sp. SCSIO 61187]QYG91120.1 TetR/AcrR family transcriptional regulator [Iamia sp. SCSIO 61187]
MSTPVVAPRPTPPQGQRERILDTALDLMAERGASATSMRALASACGLNVAALYHYFASKDALLRAVIEERRYGAQLQAMPVPDLRLPPAERLAALVVDMWDGALAEATIWKLLLSEALHGDGTAREVGAELLATLEEGLRETLPRLVPELAVDVDLAARSVCAVLVALLVEASLVEPAALHAHAERRALDLATLLLPPG